VRVHCDDARMNLAFVSAPTVLGRVGRLSRKIAEVLEASGDIAVYQFIQDRFRNSDVKADPVFRFLFSKFYDLSRELLGQTFDDG
jgi:hypothetical protein